MLSASWSMLFMPVGLPMLLAVIVMIVMLPVVSVTLVIFTIILFIVIVSRFIFFIALPVYGRRLYPATSYLILVVSPFCIAIGISQIDLNA
jgi:hypothetical protein